MMEDLWIVVEDGEVFEGTLAAWEDCFFSGATTESIRNYCELQGWDVRFEPM